MGGFAAVLIPMIPGLVKVVLDIIAAARADEGTPEEVKAKLDAISLNLQSVVLQVQAAELPNKQAVG
jgi:hypothetical protein